MKEGSVSSTGTRTVLWLQPINVWDVVEKMGVVELLDKVYDGQHRSKYTQYKQKQNKSADIPFL